LSIIEYAGN